MDHIVQSLQDSYMKMVAAAAAVLEAKEAAGGERNERTDRALKTFLESQQHFEAACDKAQEFVESVRQRIGSECLVDEATGPVAAKLSSNAVKGPIAPLSAVRLEQLSKAVRWFVIELQHGGAGAAAAAGAAGDET